MRTNASECTRLQEDEGIKLQFASYKQEIPMELSKYSAIIECVQTNA